MLLFISMWFNKGRAPSNGVVTILYLPLNGEMSLVTLEATALEATAIKADALMAGHLA